MNSNFQACYRLLIGLRSEFWLGQPNTLGFLGFKLLLCHFSWKVYLCHSVSSLMDCNRFSSRICPAFGSSHFSHIPNLLPANKEHANKMMLPLPCFSAGMMFLGWKAVLAFHQTWHFAQGPKRLVLVSWDHRTFSHKIASTFGQTPNRISYGMFSNNGFLLDSRPWRPALRSVQASVIL